MDHKNRMLIDATHPEETRVVVLKGNRVEEFDFESAARKPLRGNIYLAKVTRVEPSLQAAFVEYGGNRHGFLAFSEIHPDYYQIPKADREALLQEEAEAEAEAEAQADARAEAGDYRGSSSDDAGGDHESPGSDAGDSDAPARADASGLDAPHRTEPYGGQDVPQGSDEANGGDAAATEGSGEVPEVAAGHVEEVVDSVEAPETLTPTDDGSGASEDVLEEMPERPRRRMRSYKIQEVIKRRQIILIQVVKEERGTKGAALTTYLSLAGRYTVLMPNTGRGGGISRKIGNSQDRKRLKSIAGELDVPEGMGLIIRTAGASRTKQEIKRDYDYLLRLWESVRDMTLQSVAPCLVYEEGDLIKRSIRDLFTKDVHEIVVSGDAAYKEAHDFMRMLMPSHVKNVIHHQDPEPIFARYPIERQLNAMFSPHVTLRSGGYIVINQTEALVAIDVNSGKSTREFSIEETALNTNLEAAEEIARQLKLRDLAGLIVVDFIDMEEKRNNRAVERRLKDALRFDRARIQVGRISHFGLLEMSRQRLRTGVVEGSSTACPHCQGSGQIRSTESIALAVLRGIDEHLTRDHRSSIKVGASAHVALYVLNQKRSFITEMEERHGVRILVEASERMHGANFAIERSSEPVLTQRRAEPKAVVNMEWGFDDGEVSEPHAAPDLPQGNVEEIDTDAEADEFADGGADERGRDHQNGRERHADRDRGDRSDDDRSGRRRRRRRGRGRDRGEHDRFAGGGEGRHESRDGGDRDHRHHDDNGHHRHEQGAHEAAAGEHNADPAEGHEGGARAEAFDGNGEDMRQGRDNGGRERQGRDEGGRDDGGERRGRRRRRGRRGGRRGEGGGFEHGQGGDRGGEPGGDFGSANVSGAQSLLEPSPGEAGRGGGYAAMAAAALISSEPVAPSVREEPRYVPEQRVVRDEPKYEPPGAIVDAAMEDRAPVRAMEIERETEQPAPEPLLTPIVTSDADPSRPVRKGWWQRKFSSE